MDYRALRIGHGSAAPKPAIQILSNVYEAMLQGRATGLAEALSAARIGVTTEVTTRNDVIKFAKFQFSGAWQLINENGRRLYR